MLLAVFYSDISPTARSTGMTPMGHGATILADNTLIRRYKRLVHESNNQ